MTTTLLARIRRAALLLAVALAGCQSLPRVTPDLAPADPSSVQFQAASGRVLSPERSREILERLAGPDKVDTLARHLALEQALVEKPLSLGNRVTLLQNGPQTYEAMLGAIAAAKDSINMETYILDDDDAGRRFSEALIAKRRQGVAVQLIHDGVGTLSTPTAFFDRLKGEGIAVVEFNPVNPLRAKAGWDVNQRDHRKLLVVDGQVAIMGGINISSVYSTNPSGSGSARSGGGSGSPKKGESLPWRDIDLRIEGPVVADFQKIFFATWEDQKGPAPQARDFYPSIERRGSEVVRAIPGTPDAPFSDIYVTLVSAINSAETEIWITNAYFVPDPQLLTALVAAVRRGVDVKIIVPSVTDSSLVFYAGRSHYQKLLDGGVQLFERRDALLHAKTVVIDGVWSTVGSTNLDWRSFLHNQELSAVILGPEFGETMKESFRHDLANSDPITPERWARRGLDVRAKEWFSRLWEYWL